MENLSISNKGNEALRNENVIRVRDSRITRIYTNEGVGYVTISYAAVGPNNMLHNYRVTLVIGPNTIILSPYGDNFSFNNLRVGMIVDADFSTKMTKSIPPQSEAFKIVVSYKNWPFNSKTDRVLEVDVNNRYLYTGFADDIYSQMRFLITNSTLILDRRGNRISLRDIRAGQMVRIDFATFMTLSFPPQTTAFFIQVL
ncbi:hypothetical protein [Candidatus Clostridium stratigraminis]|uniref:Uncharacterized protein n=1 Tax=Candidatus Clostridium stratigraminis TaxID=3381661 RepID=A0ABW8T8B9_9CLOT